MVLELLHFLNLNRFESSHALEHLIEIYFVSIKFRTIHTHETSLSTHRDTASTAHSRSINHDGVEGNISRYIIFLCQQTAELHHDGRTNGKALVHLLALNHLLNTNGYHTLLSVASIVSHDDDFVGMLAHFVLKNNQLLRTSSKHRNHLIACLFECLDDRQHRCHTHTTTSTNNCAEVFNMGSLTQRTYYVCDVITFIQVTKFCGRISNLLHYESDSTIYRVGICNSEWHTFAFITNTHDNKVTRLARLSNQWGFNYKLENLLRELLFLNDFVHFVIRDNILNLRFVNPSYCPTSQNHNKERAPLAREFLPKFDCSR